MKIRKLFILTASSFFYVGYLPLVPGTFGSLTGAILFLSVKNNTANYLLLTLSLTLLGFLVSGTAEMMAGEKDASHIVIDEVSGMLLSLFFIPYDIKLLFLAFILFRILDSFKPFPAGSLQKLRGSLGIMGDDIIAAIYTNIILQLVLRLASFKIS
jgi:phosphatidylglycerophosphatase A